MIYAVDDQEIFLKSLKIVFGENKIKTFTVPNDAFLSLLTDRPSLLITDVFMPLKSNTNENILPRGMDGFKLVEIVQASLPETEIIVVSGNSREEIEKKYPGKLGKISYFFNKPLGEDFFNLANKIENKKKI